MELLRRIWELEVQEFRLFIDFWEIWIGAIIIGLIIEYLLDRN